MARRETKDDCSRIFDTSIDFRGLHFELIPIRLVSVGGDARYSCYECAQGAPGTWAHASPTLRQDAVQ